MTRLAWWYLAAAGALALVHGTGITGDVALLVLSVSTPIAMTVGIRRFAPAPTWPWWLLIAAGVVWSIAGAVRSAAGATADLSAERSVVPDVFAVPGYLMFVVALVGIGWARHRGAPTPGLLVDTIILTAAACLVAWVLLVNPVLGIDASRIAIAAISVYPPLSVVVVAAAAFVAFGAGPPTPTHRLLLAGTLLLLLGDLIFIPIETQTLVPSTPWFEIPYGLAYATMGAAVLHPGLVSTTSTHQHRTGPRTRRALVAVSLVTPAVLIVFWSPTNRIEQVAIGGIAVAMSAAAASRLVIAMKQQDEATRAIEHRATHSDLTGLPNRMLLAERLDAYLLEARHDQEPITVAFLDLDRFKLVNDTFGHAAGDRLIRRAAERLTDSVRDVDLLAHLSGDEFVIVAKGVGRDTAPTLGERIRMAFAEPFDVHGSRYMTTTVGIAIAEPDEPETDATTLLREADTAMYEAKRLGRDRVALFDHAMRYRTEHRLELEHSLRDALDRDELSVYYQLVVDSDTGAPAGVEALLRWHRDGQFVPPDDFIPIAEDTGMIEGIGAWVLEEACQQVARWRRLEGCEHLTLAVNLSPRQLANDQLTEIVAAVLLRSGLPPSALYLEITEVVMIEHSLDTLATLASLRSLGVHLSADDFGTGYSSLSYLQRYPFDQVKIDRSFIRNVDIDQTDQQLVTAVVDIARTLGMTVVAEGIERVEQAELIAGLGCQHSQGYYYARPAPAIDVGPMLFAAFPRTA